MVYFSSYACVTSAKFSFRINGRLEGKLEGKQGIRQGDPLSPYLFVLWMDYLTRLFKARLNASNFHFHPKCGKLGLFKALGIGG